MEALGSMDMKPVLGFPDATTSVDNRLSSGRLMPWISWEEWDFVRDSLFSSSPDAVASALSRISAWRSRGFLPVVIEVTASIIEIQQKDPFFRVDQTNDTLHSEEMLAMLYCMAIMRLVNGVVEKTRKKTEVSIAEAADAIGIPRMLIDIRHEGSHRDLPSLRLVRIASIKALGWLKSYYWEPQKEEIIFLKNEDANIREKIQNELHKLAFCLKVKKGSGSNASVIEGKHCAKLLYGRNKLISWMIGKHHSSKFEGSKKQMSKTLKCLVRLYYSFSTEVVSVLLESMLKTINSSNILGLQENSQIPPCTDHMQLVLSEWKPLMTKLSKKKPEMLISLLQAALSSIEVQEARKHECEQKMMSLESVAEVQNLSLLVVWGVRILKALNHSRPKDAASQSYDFSAELPFPNAPLMELLRKCLLLSAPRNNKLIDSAMLLAQMIGNNFLIQKINKCSSLTSLNPSVSEESSPMSTEFLSKQEKSLGEAASEFESIKLRRTKRKAVNTLTVDECRSKKRWVLAKSWNSCPIGMLPHAIGSSGILPVLDLNDPRKEVTELSDSGSPVFVRLSDGEESHGPCRSGRKRERSCDIEVAENLGAEKLRETMEEYESDDLKGRLLIDGVWKKVGEEELQALESAVRILV